MTSRADEVNQLLLKTAAAILKERGVKAKVLNADPGIWKAVLMLAWDKIDHSPYKSIDDLLESIDKELKEIERHFKKLTHSTNEY